MFSCENFTVWDLKSLTYSEVIFVCGVRLRIQFPSFVCGYPVAHLLKKTVLYSLCSLGTIVEDHLTIKHVMSRLSNLFRWSVCQYLCFYPCVLITTALWYCLKSGSVIPPALFFFLRIALAILGLLWFHINFRIICSSSVKNVMGNLTKITSNL